MNFAAPVSHDTVTTHDHIGFELGWDHAHYNVHLPLSFAQEQSPLRHGFLAGTATFGMRTLQPTHHVRKWLQLRLHAWLRGRSVELVQVTPRYLQQIDTAYCPITRVPLGAATLEEGPGAAIERVRSDAGYAAGNLAVMSAKASEAKAAHGFRAAFGFVRQIEAASVGGLHGLTAAQWARTGTLCSFVERLSHAEACSLPMLVLPPNRLRLFNPVQALQAFISLQLAMPGWSNRLVRFEDLLPRDPLKRAFQTFFHALLPRVLEAGKSAEPHELRWAIEDAWRHPLALQRWTAFASQLSAPECEHLVTRASLRKLATTRLDCLSDDQAVDGWNLDSKGYVPHTAKAARKAAPVRRPSDLPVRRIPHQARLPLD